MSTVVESHSRTDLRGIDVSLAYDDRKLVVVDAQSHVVHLRYPTRDIFEVIFEIIDTHEKFVVIASHWPSRRLGRLASDASRIAVAENIAFIVRDHVRLNPAEYLARKAANDLQPVRDKFDTPILIVGDFNDEPCDSSVIEHLQASSELDRVVGSTNDIDYKPNKWPEPATYRGGDNWLYNACWKFLAPENTGSFYIASTMSGEKFANRYQVLDNLVASRGLLLPGGVTLDPATVAIYDAISVATKTTHRPRKFDKDTKKGTSDHLPVTCRLSY